MALLTVLAESRDCRRIEFFLGCHNNKLVTRNNLIPQRRTSPSSNFHTIITNESGTYISIYSIPVRYRNVLSRPKFCSSDVIFLPSSIFCGKTNSAYTIFGAGMMVLVHSGVHHPQMTYIQCLEQVSTVLSLASFIRFSFNL